MKYEERKFLWSDRQWHMYKEKKIGLQDLKERIRLWGCVRTPEGWEHKPNEKTRITLTPAPAENRACDWGQSHGYSRTHEINTRWWMGDFD